MEKKKKNICIGLFGARMSFIYNFKIFNNKHLKCVLDIGCLSDFRGSIKCSKWESMAIFSWKWNWHSWLFIHIRPPYRFDIPMTKQKHKVEIPKMRIFIVLGSCYHCHFLEFVVIFFWRDIQVFLLLTGIAGLLYLCKKKEQMSSVCNYELAKWRFLNK